MVSQVTTTPSGVVLAANTAARFGSRQDMGQRLKQLSPKRQALRGNTASTKSSK